MAKVQKKRTPAKSKRSIKSVGTARGRGSGKTSGTLTARQVLPYFLSICLLVCIAAIVGLGYRSAVSSTFFDVSDIVVTGIDRASKPQIENIVVTETERTGVWNADLDQIKARVEKLAYVKTAAVARVLPNTVVVSVVEREPAALVELGSGPTLVDAEGSVIAPAIRPEPELPFAITGWDEAKSLDALRDNKLRVKVYRAMLSEWKDSGLIAKVISVNLKDLRDPLVLSEDSGNRVAIAVGRENFGQNLRNGMTAIAGKGDMFQGVSLLGSNLRLVPREKR